MLTSKGGNMTKWFFFMCLVFCMFYDFIRCFNDEKFSVEHSAPSKNEIWGSIVAILIFWFLRKALSMLHWILRNKTSTLSNCSILITCSLQPNHKSTNFEKWLKILVSTFYVNISVPIQFHCMIAINILKHNHRFRKIHSKLSEVI